MRNRVATVVVLCGVVASAFAVPARARHEWVTPKASPPNEVMVSIVNARQPSNRLEDARLAELADALRASIVDVRDGLALAPDVIVLNELYYTQTAKFEGMLNANFADVFDCSGATLPCPYQLAGSNFDVNAKFIINSETVSVDSVVTWNDVCDPSRTYAFARLTELDTGARFIVAGVHFSNRYEVPGDCRQRNVDQMRTALAQETLPIVVGGDFNKRPVRQEHECDAAESGPPLPWWADATNPVNSEALRFDDAVRSWFLQTGRSLATAWTHERDAPTLLCNGGSGYRRGRIDYIFTAGDLGVIQALPDLPGWGNQDVPGTYSCDPTHPSCRYSDHKIVFGHFDLQAQQPPQGVTATAISSTAIDVSWQDVGGETGYRIERADSVEDPWTPVATVGPDLTSYSDRRLQASHTYRYRVIALNAEGESAPSDVAVATTSPDEVAPRRPRGLVAFAVRSGIKLEWNAVRDRGGGEVEGYQIWRRSRERGRFRRVATTVRTRYRDIEVVDGKRYSYYVRAFDEEGNTSERSRTASARA